MKGASAAKQRARPLLRDYLAAMRAYVKKPSEAGLECASELGRLALDQGTAVVDLAAFYHQALTTIVCSKARDECARKLNRLATFSSKACRPLR